ncbi:MAG: hypothetical protein C0591_10055 [Marinilabiliales bacterium]|nr:MAG: hypothetical protein C0591_10055 [Marinilabiliales bacterium]
MKKIGLLIFIFLFTILAFGQVDFASNVKKNEVEEKKQPLLEIKRTVDVGAGFGLDYGGIIGLQVTYIPIKYAGVITSIGYYAVNLGWQIGVKGFILPKTNLKKVRPTVKFMYGTNRLIIVDGASQFNKSYLGFTPGAGVEFRFGAKKTHGLNLDVNIPINSSEFNEDYQALIDNPAIDITAPPSPIAISVGYHFEF